VKGPTVYTAVCDDGDFRAALHPFGPVLDDSGCYRVAAHPFRVVLQGSDGDWYPSFVGSEDPAWVSFRSVADAIRWLLDGEKPPHSSSKSRGKRGRRNAT